MTSITGISAVSDVQQSVAAAAAQEASETQATTMQEAARGDQQAVRRLAKEQGQQQPAAPAPTSQPNTSGLVDALA
jgi:hypothetical protein